MVLQPRALAWPLLYAASATAFYLPGSAPTTYHRGDSVPLLVNSLKSFVWSRSGDYSWQAAHDAYSPQFGFCAPSPDKLERVPTSLGSTLFGDRLYNSLFDIKMLEPATCKPLCVTHLDHTQLDALKNGGLDLFHDWSVDELPIAQLYRDPFMTEDYYSPGIPLGLIDLDFRVNEQGWFESVPQNWTLNNHFRLILEYHRPKHLKDAYRIVGALVQPKSIDSLGTRTVPDCTVTEPLLLVNDSSSGQQIAYTYDVVWKESTTPWATRWDYYLRAWDQEIHIVSLVSSIVIALFLCLVAALAIARLLSKDIRRYNALSSIPLTAHDSDQDDGFMDKNGWKSLDKEVARPPRNRMWLSILVGNGVQVMLMGSVTLVFACLGVLSPANRGGLTNALITTWTLFGFFAGYIASRIYLTWNGQALYKLILYTSILLPTALLGTLFVLNFWLIGADSAGAIPFWTFVQLAALWYGIQVPLAIVGGWAGARKGAFSHPLSINDNPREIPAQPLYLHPIFSALSAGVLPFVAGFMKMFFLLQSVFGSKLYFAFGYMFFASLVLCVTTALTSVLATYIHLMRGDYRWQSRSLMIGVASAFYLLLYLLLFWTTKLRIHGITNKVLYLSYVGGVCAIFGLVVGTVSFLSSAFFIKLI
ncbi:transmembrane 9 family protein [Sporobolomyces koalae]|uniref:transmembrane 9 family protein n=1 Tax=Sporobolomyces koalae TaxID=500713 RepID=UPI0031759E88